MKEFYVKQTHRTPEIKGSVNKGELSIKGRSLPEDAKDFYLPFKKWLSFFLKSNAEKLLVKLELEYFNTATSKVLVDMMMNLDKLRDSKDIKVMWIYDEDDLEMEEVGGDFKLLLGELVQLQPKSIN